MRNLLHRCSLLVAATLLATVLLSSGFSADPAGASTLSRRIHRPYRFRASRSAFRAPVLVVGDVWTRLRSCESGGRYTTNIGYPGLPHQAPPEVQDEAARKLQARSGWGQWPVCSRRIGAR